MLNSHRLRRNIGSARTFTGATFLRVLFGAQISLLVGVVGALVSLIIGVLWVPLPVTSAGAWIPF